VKAVSLLPKRWNGSPAMSVITTYVLALATLAFFAAWPFTAAHAQAPTRGADSKSGAKRGSAPAATAASPSAAAASAAAATAAAATALGTAHGAPTASAIDGTFDDAPFEAGELRGKVVRVVDGDTLWLVREGATKPMKLRIEGIDAPEICQAFGPEAKRALANRVLDRDVTAKLRAVDDWGRRIGHVYDGETNVGQRMVRDGMAWSIRYRWDRGPYVADERLAQSFFRGLHADGKAEMPRTFRQRHGSCYSDEPAREDGSSRRRGGGGGGR
jgi:micrococcal nuclease